MEYRLYLIKCLIIGWVILAILIVIFALAERIDNKLGRGFCLCLLLMSVIAIIIGSIILEVNNL